MSARPSVHTASWSVVNNGQASYTSDTLSATAGGAGLLSRLASVLMKITRPTSKSPLSLPTGRRTLAYLLIS